MQTALSRLLISTLLLSFATVGGAQDPNPAAPQAELPASPAKPVSPSDEFEPAVNTSALPVQGDAKPSVGQSSAKPTKSATPGPGGHAHDRLQLDTTEITGNRELPKVLYIVPWKRSDLGDIVGRPVNSLLDEVLEPVDRDVFRRENRYYRALQPDSSATAAPAPPK